jgi:hypothetical protein
MAVAITARAMYTQVDDHDGRNGETGDRRYGVRTRVRKQPAP